FKPKEDVALAVVWFHCLWPTCLAGLLTFGMGLHPLQPTTWLGASGVSFGAAGLLATGISRCNYRLFRGAGISMLKASSVVIATILIPFLLAYPGLRFLSALERCQEMLTVVSSKHDIRTVVVPSSQGGIGMIICTPAHLVKFRECSGRYLLTRDIPF